jgi:hypothetical protein
MGERAGVYVWDRPGVPHKGWPCLDVEDHEEPCFTCEMCGYPAVRFVHVMEHPEYPDEVSVGCVCAGHMEDDQAAARERERVARNAAARRGRLPDRYRRAFDRWSNPWLWRVSEKGNSWRTFRRSRVVIFPDSRTPGCWKSAVDGWFSPPLASAEDARIAAFHYLFPPRKLLDDLEANGRSTIRLPGKDGS